MRIPAIIQVRMRSERLPGKTFMSLEDRPLIAHLVDRVRKAKTVDQIILAIPNTEDNEKLEKFARSYGVEFFRGPESDVLKRFVLAAEEYGADALVRLTGDNPLVEPDYIDKAVKLHIKESADLTVAKDQNEIPLGFGCEVVSLGALKTADHKAKEKEDREHVTWYILRPENREEFRVVFLKGRSNLKNGKIRLTVDTKEDFRLMNEVFKRLYRNNSLFGLKEVLELLKKEPQLFEINKGVKQKKDLYKK